MNIYRYIPHIFASVLMIIILVCNIRILYERRFMNLPMHVYIYIWTNGHSILSVHSLQQRDAIGLGYRDYISP